MKWYKQKTVIRGIAILLGFVVFGAVIGAVGVLIYEAVKK